MRSEVLVFDVNETLLDLEALTPLFVRVFADRQAMRQWFAELILYSQTLTLCGDYLPFGKLAVEVLHMVARIRGLSLTAGDITEFRDRMAALPAHQDALPALEKLSAAGFRMVTLTNSSAQAGQQTLAQSGLAHFFDKQFSVEEVSRFKPAAENYANVARALGKEPGSLRLIAAHTWDILGAMACGWKGALVARPGNAVLEIGPQPDVVEKDLLAVAQRIITIERAG